MKIKDKTGKSELELIFGFIVFFIIIFVFLSNGIFGMIFSAFNIPAFGGFGFILGVFFIIAIILGLFGKIIGR